MKQKKHKFEEQVSRARVPAVLTILTTIFTKLDARHFEEKEGSHGLRAEPNKKA